MKDIILNIVNDRNGIKSVDLALAVMDAVNPVRFTLEQFYNDVDDLVHRGEIRELQYMILDNIKPYEVRSLYFNANTAFVNYRRTIDEPIQTASKAVMVRKS